MDVAERTQMVMDRIAYEKSAEAFAEQGAQAPRIAAEHPTLLALAPSAARARV